MEGKDTTGQVYFVRDIIDGRVYCVSLSHLMTDRQQPPRYPYQERQHAVPDVSSIHVCSEGKSETFRAQHEDVNVAHIQPTTSTAHVSDNHSSSINLPGGLTEVTPS